MAQVLKDEVREALVRSALQVFARSGFHQATVGDIAREAGMAAGNVYRYFEDKRALYAACVPRRFVADFDRLLRARVRAARGLRDVRALGPTDPYSVQARALLAFCIAHRLRVLVLLSGAPGAPDADFPEALVRTLSRLAVAHFRQRGLARGAAGLPQRSVLEAIYRNYVHLLVQLLRQLDSPRALERAVEELSRYHLAGLGALFER